MAVTQPPLGYARDPSAGTSSRAVPGSLGLRAASVVIAVFCIGLGLTIAAAYPIAPLAAMGVFVAWTAFATFRFSYALPATIALIPIVGLATWTGWYTFEETDLLILASAAGGYASIVISGPPPPPTGDRRFVPQLSIFSIALIVLFLAMTVVALARGISAAGGLTFEPFDWSAGYDSAQNCLRIFKPFFLAVLATPLLLRELRTPGGFDRFGAGMTVALGLGAAVVLRERLAFTGLLDFSDDYRITGSFWEMHVGGAALDGFLALTIPFAVREAIRKASRVRYVAAMAVLALAAYACLVTFSRGVYAAIPLALLTLAVLAYRQRAAPGARTIWIVLLKAFAFAAVVAISGVIVFRSGGYRATLACLVVIALAIPVDAALRRGGPLGWLVACLAAAACATFGILLATVLPKGPYVVFGIATLVGVAAIGWMGRSRLRMSATVVIAAWLWLGVCAAHAAHYWGGEPALRDTAVVMAALVVLVFGASLLPRSVWPTDPREQIATVGAGAIVLAAVAVFSGGSYMGDRFAASRGDFGGRMAHWTNGIGRLHGPSDWLFGKGMGRFPATSVFESLDSTVPGTYSVGHRDGETFLALTGPRLRYTGFNEYFRASQRVSLTPNTPYAVTLEIRSQSPEMLHIEVCEKQLLYMNQCRDRDIDIPGAKAGWQRVVFGFQSGTMGSSPWWASRPAFLALAANAVEIRSVRMTGPDGVDMIANGRFTEGTNRWFSSSDRFHLPYHIKNIVLGVLFDDGIVGLGLFGILVGAALLRTSVGRARRHPDAPFVAAAIVGYLVVGGFDTLLDVPRVAFMFYLVALTGLMLRNPRVSTVAGAATPTPRPPPPVDDAAERALRRQRAFGERKPAAA